MHQHTLSHWTSLNRRDNFLILAQEPELDLQMLGFTGLNNSLAAHHDHVKALCAKAASHIDPNTYHEALRTLENQIQHIRCMYEQELHKMR